MELVMPQMGESITTGTITKWHKNVGDTVELDETILEISTDKVESEIPSPFEGKVVELLYQEGDTIDVGKVIAYIDDDMNAEVSSSASKPTAKKEEAPKEAAPIESAPQVSNQSNESGERRFYTPLVKAMAQDAGVSLSELSSINGSGAGGRVNKSDLENYLANRGEAKSSAPSASALPSGGKAQTTASGDRVEVIAMDNMRKAIAKNMVQSKMTSPHVNSIDEIDMTNLVREREKIKKEFKAREGVNLTYSHFVLYALAQALKEHPLVNASIDGDNIVVKKDIHLGCAVAVPGNGLVVPVIRNAGDLNLTGLAKQVDQLANKARNKKLTMEELTGGTFTFTNVGSFGTLMATPVILQPQVGIFASGVIKKRMMIMEDDSMAVRHMMYGTHTYDHRLVDGELGGKFLASVKWHLENMKIENLL